MLGTDGYRSRELIRPLDFTDGSLAESINIVATMIEVSEQDIDVFGIDNLEPANTSGEVIGSAESIEIVDQNQLALRIGFFCEYDEQNEDFIFGWYFAKHGVMNVQLNRAQRRQIGFQYIRCGKGSRGGAVAIHNGGHAPQESIPWAA